MKIGEHIGDYEVVEVLGNGGMGEVYKVRNLLSERVEAMKVLLPNLAGNPELAERFLREIKLQASLDHPNIAKLHTALRDSNQLLMVMEFVEGISLEKLLAHGALLTHDAVGYAGQVLDALAYAHARGVVHRDIKPANLMRTPAGTIKLLDFGIAHMKADHKLTQTGTTLGSLYYIAPELIDGREPDPRCDIYSLGVVLYEMVTGNKPFQGDSQYSILAAHMQAKPVAPADVAPWLAGPLNDVILKAMAKDPGERFQSAEAFKNAIESAVGPAPDQAATQALSSARTQAVPLSAAPAQRTPGTCVPVSAAEPPAQAAASPTAAAAQMPRQTAHRGLYVALGSLLTLAVLAAAAMETPKFFKTHADQSAVRQPSPASPSPTISVATTESTQTNASSPAATQPGSNRPGQENKQATTEQASAQNTGLSPEALQSFQAQMREVRATADELNVRARAANSGLSSIKAQMAAQGLGLRSDVLDAEAHMNHLLEKAQREIASGDAFGAERDLQMAGYAIDVIDKFLGH